MKQSLFIILTQLIKLKEQFHGLRIISSADKFFNNYKNNDLTNWPNYVSN